MPYDQCSSGQPLSWHATGPTDGALASVTRTTQRIRAERQKTPASLCIAARQLGLDPKTILKWRKQSTATDVPMGPRIPKSTVFTLVEEAIIVGLRRCNLLPLEDVMDCLRDTPQTSAAARCIGASSGMASPACPNRQTFGETQAGYVHIDCAPLRSAEGVTDVVLAIDQVSKFADVKFHAGAEMTIGAAFIRVIVAAFRHQIRKVPTGNGAAFIRNASLRYDTMQDPFNRVGKEHAIEHTLIKLCHSWTNSKAERMNRTVTDATTKVFHHETTESLRAHVLLLVSAYNFARQLKAAR